VGGVSLTLGPLVEQEQPKTKPWIVHLVVFASSTLILTIVLELLAVIGARDFLHHVSDDASDALRRFTPWAFVQRFFTYFERSSDPRLTLLDYIAPGNYLLAAFYMLKDSFSISSFGGFVSDSILVLFGVAVGVTTARDGGAVGAIAGIAAGIASVLALSTIVLVLMFVAGAALSHAIPAAPLGIYGGSVATVFIAVLGRSAEGGMHHAVSSVIQRAFFRAH
jgi:hypothetical protein